MNSLRCVRSAPRACIFRLSSSLKHWLSAIAGFSIAVLIGLLVVQLTSESALPVVMTPRLTGVLFLLTLVMCVISALASIVKVLRMDPAMVFSR